MLTLEDFMNVRDLKPMECRPSLPQLNLDLRLSSSMCWSKGIRISARIRRRASRSVPAVAAGALGVRSHNARQLLDKIRDRRVSGWLFAVELVVAPCGMKSASVWFPPCG